MPKKYLDNFLKQNWSVRYNLVFFFFQRQKITNLHCLCCLNIQRLVKCTKSIDTCICFKETQHFEAKLKKKLKYNEQNYPKNIQHRSHFVGICFTYIFLSVTKYFYFLTDIFLLIFDSEYY